MAYYLFFYMFTTILLLMESVSKNKILLILVLISAFFFSALRFDAGYDYFSYLNLIVFETGVSFDRLEFLNKPIILISRKFQIPQIYFIITSFIYIYAMALGLKESKSFTGISLLLLLFFVGSYLSSFDIVRQMVAASIIFYATSLVINKKYIASGFLFLIAMGFHKSSIIYLIILTFVFFFKKERSFIFYTIFLASSLLLLNPIISILASRNFYYSYIESGGNESGNNIYILIVFYFFTLLILAKLINIKLELFWKALNLFFLGVILYTVFLPYGYFVTRISYYLIPWSFVAWSLLYETTIKNKRFIYIIIFLISSFSYFIALYISSFNPRDPLLNYSLFFLS